MLNVFIFTLESHKVSVKNIIKVFLHSMQSLDRDYTLKINKELVFICIFTMMFLKNMLQ